MNKKLVLIPLLIVGLAQSCKENKPTETVTSTEEKVVDIATAKPADTTTTTTEKTAKTNDEIIKSSAKGKNGDVLDLSYNTTKGTATAVLKGETIELKQEITGSGTLYSNEHYELAEHQGKLTLSKDDKIIFEN